MAINYSLVKLASKFGDKAGVPLFYARAQMNTPFRSRSSRS